jgi:hypothetical protein
MQRRKRLFSRTIASVVTANGAAALGMDRGSPFRRAVK